MNTKNPIPAASTTAAPSTQSRRWRSTAAGCHGASHRGAFAPPPAPIVPPVRAQTASRRLPARIARACDSFLDFIVLAFAAWTVVYHVFLVAGVGAVAAVATFAVALVPCGWLAFRATEEHAEPLLPPRAAPWARRRTTIALGVFAAAALGASAIFAFSELAWSAVWPLIFLVAVAGLVFALARAEGKVALQLDDANIADEGPGWPEVAVALAWSAALAILSLYLLRPAADDAFYARVSSWIAAHGTFPTRDVLFSDNVFPAVIYPPVASIEALVGAIGYVTSLAVPHLLYFGMTGFASALAVLAMWRLVRRWATPMAGVALSVALVFLLYDARDHNTFGNLFIGRIWEGKVAFLAILVPLLFVFLADYVERPSHLRLLVLGAAGAAAVGLTSSALFLVPVLAAGSLAPFVLRAPRRAVLGFAAVTAYPLGALVVRAALGGRRAAEDTPSDVVAGKLVHIVLGTGMLALVVVTAMLVGPIVVRRVVAAPMAAGVVALVVLLYAPPLPRLVFEATGIGRVLWRLNWLVPAAVLVGVVATSVLAHARPRALRVLPAVGLIALLVAAGNAIWSSIPVAEHPSWKLPFGTVPAARRIVSAARPGDVVLAPRQLSQTVSIISGEVTTVAPRLFYTRALKGTPEAHAEERILLQSFAELGVGAPFLEAQQLPPEGKIVEPAGVRRALRRVGVDIACVVPDPESEALLESAGYAPFLSERRVICMRAAD
jgi:Family of unknown function (DUF6077)